MSTRKPEPPDQRLVESILHENERSDDQSRAALIMRADRLIPQLQEQKSGLLKRITQIRGLIELCGAEILEIENARDHSPESIMEDLSQEEGWKRGSQFFNHLFHHNLYGYRGIIDVMFMQDDKTAEWFQYRINELIQRASQIIDSTKKERILQFQKKLEGEKRDIEGLLQQEIEELQKIIREFETILDTFEKWIERHPEIAESATIPINYRIRLNPYGKTGFFPYHMLKEFEIQDEVTIGWEFTERDGIQWSSYRNLVIDEQPFCVTQILTPDKLQRSINDWVVTRTYNEPAHRKHIFSSLPKTKITNRRVQILVEEGIPEKIGQICTMRDKIKDIENRLDRLGEKTTLPGELFKDEGVTERFFQAFLEPLHEIKGIVAEIRDRARAYLEISKEELKDNEQALKRVMDAIASS